MDTSLTGKPAKYFIICLIAIGIVGVSLPIYTASTIEDWCTQQSGGTNYAPDDCPEMNENQINGKYSASLLLGAFMAILGFEVGGMFAFIRHREIPIRKQRDISTCPKFKETGWHEYDKSNLQLKPIVSVSKYWGESTTYVSQPIKCEYCDETQEFEVWATELRVKDKKENKHEVQ